MAALTGVTIFCVCLALIHPPLLGPAEVPEQLNFIVTGAQAVQLVVSSICFAVSMVPCARKCLSVKGLEITAVIYMSLLVVMLPLLLRPYAARLLVADPRTGPQDMFLVADTHLLLSMVIYVTAANLVLPVRFAMLLPFELLSYVVYTICVLISGGLHALSFQLAFGFVLLTCFASAGKWASEQLERDIFLVLQDLEQMRCRAEVVLPQSEDLPEKRPSTSDEEVATSARGPSANMSLPSTTGTARMFDTEGQDLPFSLDRLKAIGIQEQWILPDSEICVKTDRILGSGGFGVVLCAEYNGSEVAVKIPKTCAEYNGSEMAVQIPKTSARQRLLPGQLNILCNELRSLRRLRHPNIVVLYGACLDSPFGDLALIMELLHGGTLDFFITHQHPTGMQGAQILADVSAALGFLHSRQPSMLHGDLKDSNVFVEAFPWRTTRCRAKLLDFGLSMLRTKHARARGGTAQWMAPEATYKNWSPHSSADVFAFGLLTCFVVTGTVPQWTLSGDAWEAEFENFDWSAVLGPSHRLVVERCCHKSPAERPGIAAVRQLLAAASNDADPNDVLQSLNPMSKGKQRPAPGAVGEDDTTASHEVKIGDPMDSATTALNDSKFQVLVELPIDLFFSQQSHLVLDERECVVLSCSAVLRMSGVCDNDIITHINNEPLQCSSDFRNAICRIFSEMSSAAEHGNIVLTLSRTNTLICSSYGRSHGHSQAKTWHSMSSSATAEGMGLPGKRLHDVKQQQMEQAVQKLVGLAKPVGPEEDADCSV